MIREWMPQDVKRVAPLYCDDEVMKYITGRAYTSCEIEEFFPKRIVNQAQRGMCFWALCLKDGEEIIGHCGLQPCTIVRESCEPSPSTQHPSLAASVPESQVELGYLLARGYWGNGFAQEAAQATLEYARDILKLRRVIGVVEEENHASIRLLERLGMSKDGPAVYKGERVIAYSKTLERIDHAPN